MNKYKIKLIACDIDGTLYNDDRIFPQITIDTIKKVLDNNIMVCLASGRSPYSQRIVRKELGLENMPMIAYNGAQVLVPNNDFSENQSELAYSSNKENSINLKSNTELDNSIDSSRKVIFDQNLSVQDALKIIKMGEERGTSMFIWADKLYANVDNERTQAYTRIADMKPIISKDFEQIANKGVKKVIWDDDPIKIAEFEKGLPSSLDETINHFTSCSFFLEFVDRTVSKGNALQKLAEYYGFNKDQVAAFGDDRNDLSMLKYATHSVAMGNGVSELKQIAKYIAPTNNENGVAYYINKLIFNE